MQSSDELPPGFLMTNDKNDDLKLRDRLAADAMVVLLRQQTGDSDLLDVNADVIAFKAYEMADAMLAVRSTNTSA